MRERAGRRVVDLVVRHHPPADVHSTIVAASSFHRAVIDRTEKSRIEVAHLRKRGENTKFSVRKRTNEKLDSPGEEQVASFLEVEVEGGYCIRLRFAYERRIVSE